MKLGTEFTIKYRDGYTRRVMLVESNEIGNNNIVLKYLDVINNEYNYVDIHRDLVDAKFIPVQKPVSFMEAVESGKEIKVNSSELVTGYLDLHEMMEQLSVRTTKAIKEILKNGLWYIEEE